MLTQELVALAELIAAIAVVITLLYVAKQVRQSNTLARAQTRQRNVEQASEELYKGFVDDPSILRSLYKQEPLSEDEWIRLSGWLLAAMRQREYEYFQMKNGSIEREVWEAYRELITIHLGTERTRKWWDNWGDVPFDPGFRAMVAELLDKHSKPHYFEGLQRIIDDADPGPTRIDQ
jgi:hypothetical protein